MIWQILLRSINCYQISMICHILYEKREFELPDYENSNSPFLKPTSFSYFIIPSAIFSVASFAFLAVVSPCTIDFPNASIGDQKFAIFDTNG